MLKETGEFEINSYHLAKPFSSFLPGVAGLIGKPLWCFYVNRGQGICSFGVENRDHMILEFMPADQAYQRTGSLGFRTFYKIFTDPEPCFYEPFQSTASSLISQKMVISIADVSFEDVHHAFGLKTTVSFCTLPNCDFPALMRQITIQNLSDKTQRLELIDGLPRLMPFGMNEFFCKNMSRTSEAWMGVENLSEQGVPFYKLKVIPLDAAKVQTLVKGHFYCCFDEHQMITPLVDPVAIFGANTDFSYPAHFFTDKPFVFPNQQACDNRTPSAMIHYNLTLEPLQTKTFYQLVGQMDSLSTLQDHVHLFQASFFTQKQSENRMLMEGITSRIHTVSHSSCFDRYTQQTYLDNVLRGGLPVTLGKDQNKASIFYAFSRKHGDLERDYNRFSIAPTYYSQGNGNYRDVNQNRRSDVFFNSDLGAHNIIHMLNFIQLDGYNPLTITGTTYHFCVPKTLDPELLDFKTIEGFSQLGDLYSHLTARIPSETLRTEVFQQIVLASTPIQGAEHQEGFWSDHWHYNLDLIENFLSIFPDKRAELFWDTKAYRFYDDCYEVLPRHKRYVLNESGQPRQLHFIKKNSEKEKLILNRKTEPHYVRTKYGKGAIYETNLMVKLLHIILIKAATLDPAGLGIEMEAGKPNWCDAINGLPALFGSSSAESFELIRWARFLLAELTENRTFHLPEELMDFFIGMVRLTEQYPTLANPNHAYWNQANTLKEIFRFKTTFGISGTEKKVSSQEVALFIKNLLKRLETTELSWDPQSGVYITYFRFEPETYTIDPVTQEITITAFQKAHLPLFLEGPVHRMKLMQTPADAFQLFQAIRQSALYDAKLQMYKINASLASESIEIGRNKVFTPGWLENESIWLHMEYKYLLELLKSGLYREFEQTIRDILIAFQDVNRYGRSILENSSFIASSANPDERLHGQGFISRLSGSTAEFVQIWILMFFGKKLFHLEEDKLFLSFEPKIPGWLFSDFEKTVSYQTTDQTHHTQVLPRGSLLVYFLGSIPVIFYNSDRVSTWDRPISKVKLHPIQGEAYDIMGNAIPNAALLRDQKINLVEIFI